MSKQATSPSLGEALRSLDVRGAIGALRSEPGIQPCYCDASFEDDVLHVDADDCDGDLRENPHCRRTVVQALEDRNAESITVSSNGFVYRYADDGVAMLSAAGRFLELLGDRNERLAEDAAVDPLGVAEEIAERVDDVADVGVESGIVEEAAPVESYEAVLTPKVGLTIGYYYLDRSTGDGARLRDVTSLDTGSEVRIYDRADGIPLYSLDLIDVDLDVDQRDVLLESYEAIANGVVEGDRAASRAIEYATDEPVDPTLTGVLSKHTHGYGVLEDLFADPRVSDVFMTSPVGANPLRVAVDGQTMETNVYLDDDGARALASRVRRTSGRAFSRASPTVDATASLDNGTGIRIAGVTDPVADGVGFAFREQADDTFTLPELVANGTMPAEVAAFLSVAAERNAALLIAGTRGAGKTTLLGTLLYELTPATRTVLIEDTPELPVEQLQSVDRDVQALRTGTGDGPEISLTGALRTALRMGDGAIVIGEIRGEEARVLYEAMRVGANADAVMGTIHGDGAEEVFERVVSDLGVEPTSFAATDLVVTVQAYEGVDGQKRRVSRVEEVMNEGDDVWFAPLFEMGAEQAESTDRIDRGESRVVDHLAGPGEAYADVRVAIEERADLLSSLARDGRTGPEEVASAYADRSG